MEPLSERAARSFRCWSETDYATLNALASSWRDLTSADDGADFDNEALTVRGCVMFARRLPPILDPEMAAAFRKALDCMERTVQLLSGTIPDSPDDGPGAGASAVFATEHFDTFVALLSGQRPLRG